MLVTILHTQNFIKIHPFVLKTLNGNKILISIKGHNSVEKQRKIICNCLYLHFVNINVITKFYQNPSIGPQDIEHKQNFNINQGHNSVENERKILFNHPNLHLLNINAYTKFDRNPQINSQDIEHKQISDIDQGP